MKYLTFAAALGVALAASIASAAPPAAPPPPITGGVRAPRGFNYPYGGGTSHSPLQSDTIVDPSGAIGPAFGYQGNRYPLGTAPAQPRVVWYW